MATKEQVAFLGPKASYTHQVRPKPTTLSPVRETKVPQSANYTILQQAALTHFPDTDKHTVTPQPTIEDIFTTVQSTRQAGPAATSHYGVVPFENSSNGSVIFTLDLFASAGSKYPAVEVCGEIYLPVRHCLLGRRAVGTPTTKDDDFAHVKKLYSHPQAWGQCKTFLTSTPHLKALERQDVSSTSRAAELVAQDASGESAAVSSRMAAEVNGLDVLAEGIEDSEGNSTRFFVLRRRRRRRDDDEEGEGGEGGHDWKTLVLFTVEHGEPGALADCLAVFKRHGLNLTSINTRPSGEAAWHYVFFVELVGRKLADGRGGAVNDALAELAKVAKSCRWLGSWENALRR